MLELYIIRHGLAGKALPDAAMDQERPLKKKGKEQMNDIAKALQKRKIAFDVVVASPLLRAKESAEIVNAHCNKKKKVTVTDLLRPDASYSDLIKFLNKLKGSKTVAIVGHEPFLSGFASYCLTKNKQSLMTLKKGGVLKLDVQSVLKPGKCTLSWLVEPDQMT